MYTPQALTSLRAHLAGPLLLPADAGYDDARKVFNAMIDRYPAAIAYAQSTQDVAHAVRWAAAQGRLLAVRGGGRNGSGLGTPVSLSLGAPSASKPCRAGGSSSHWSASTRSSI